MSSVDLIEGDLRHMHVGARLFRGFRTSLQEILNVNILSKRPCGTSRGARALTILIAAWVIMGNVAAQGLDSRILKELYKSPQNPNNALFQNFTTSADYVAVGTPVLLLGGGLLSKNSELMHKGVTSAVAVLGTYGVGYLLKNSIKKERPWHNDSTLIPFREDTGFSFPSGSTSVAFAAATSLVMAKPKWYITIPAYAYAGTVGYSRMRLGAHYPSDVLAGAIIGTSSVWISKKLTDWVRSR